MSIQDYQALRLNNIGADHKSLNCQLPQMTSATLTIDEPQYVTAIELMAEIEGFAPAQGWAMFSDQVLVDNPMPNRSGLIEGEWCKGNCTIKIKLIKADCYQLVRMTQQEGQVEHQAYQEQALLLRSNIASSSKAARYRLWWHYISEGANKGRWQVLTQQFVGFIKEDA